MELIAKRGVGGGGGGREGTKSGLCGINRQAGDTATERERERKKRQTEKKDKAWTKWNKLQRQEGRCRTVWAIWNNTKCGRGERGG